MHGVWQWTVCSAVSRFMPFWSLFCGLWLCCAWLSLYLVCPCPNRASGKGEAYLLVAFFLSLFLAFGSCPASLSVVHGTWWLRVSCCGRSLLVHSSGVTFCVLRHLLLFVLVCCLDAFPSPHEDCTAFFYFALLQCVFDALWWADTVTRWLTALFI